MEYVVIDFETGQGNRASACAIGIVTVNNGIIVDKFSSLIYNPLLPIIPKFTQIHGITKEAVKRADIFPDLLSNEILPRIENNLLVSHNESFDRGVMKASCEFYDLNYNSLKLQNPEKWDCTLKIYKNYKFISGALKYLCDDLDIELNHHEALSDSIACAQLYYKHITNDFKAKLKNGK
jgi:DNA polymerase-3 subunit epsilon